MEKVVSCVKTCNTATEVSEIDTWRISEESIIHSSSSVIDVLSDAPSPTTPGPTITASIEM